MNIVSESKWDETRTVQSRKYSIFMNSDMPIIFVKTKIKVKGDFISRIDLERINTRNFSSQFESLTYHDGINPS
jgi:hypothetical protein